MHLTGTIINNFFHCHRQCYLNYHKINMASFSNQVQIGQALHELHKTSNISIGHIAIDKLTPTFVIEYKKSNSNLLGSQYQLLYYLKVCADKGIHRKGKLICLNNDCHSSETYILELTPKTLAELDSLAIKIFSLLTQCTPPNFIFSTTCQGCSYFDYCNI